jgi:hypothetical protein
VTQRKVTGDKARRSTDLLLAVEGIEQSSADLLDRDGQSSSRSPPSPVKGAGPTTPRRDRAETSFCSATYGPKWYRAIYRDISALVHY